MSCRDAARTSPRPAARYVETNAAASTPILQHLTLAAYICPRLAGSPPKAQDARSSTGAAMDTGYLSQVSSFNSASALVIILGVNLTITLIHIVQEWKGAEVPFWRVLGAIVGVCVPHRHGFAVFTLGLLAALWLAALVGIAGLFGCLLGALGSPWGPRLGVASLGFIIGGRISDSIVSHWRLYGAGYRPNPGLSSTALYVLEAMFLLWAFRKGLLGSPLATMVGLALGALLFVAVLPSLRVLRRKKPDLRREPWLPWRPLPAWTKDPDCSPSAARP